MPDYYFPQMDVSAGPDWQMAYKVAVIIATHRGYPIEAIISQTDARFAECFPQGWSQTGTQTRVTMSTELSSAELTSLNELFSNPATVCTPGMVGWGPPTGHRLLITDIYMVLPQFIVAAAGFPEGTATMWWARSSPSLPDEVWDRLWLDFNKSLSVTERKAVETAFVGLIQWIAP